MFDGGIGGFLERYIDLSELCPEDKPALEKLAAEESVPMNKVTTFPGFRVGPPPRVTYGDIAERLERETRKDWYPIPQWSAQKLGLFEISVNSGEGKVSYSVNFSASDSKVFTFIGRKVGNKYHVVAAKYKETMRNRKDKP
ncbi:hypothetical protein K8R14_01090 [bacterium]|nr:hypothetical protein [bacterium]